MIFLRLILVSTSRKRIRNKHDGQMTEWVSSFAELVLILFKIIGKKSKVFYQEWTRFPENVVNWISQEIRSQATSETLLPLYCK